MVYENNWTKIMENETYIVIKILHNLLSSGSDLLEGWCVENNLLWCVYIGGMHDVTVVALQKPQILLCYQSSRYRALKRKFKFSVKMKRSELKSFESKEF